MVLLRSTPQYFLRILRIMDFSAVGHRSSKQLLIEVRILPCYTNKKYIIREQNYVIM